LSTSLAGLLAESMTRFMDLFLQWDVNQDGKISLKEFRKAVAMLSNVRQAEVDKLFERLDTDKSGTVDFKELNHELREAKKALRNARTASPTRSGTPSSVSISSASTAATILSHRRGHTESLKVARTDARTPKRWGPKIGASACRELPKMLGGGAIAMAQLYLPNHSIGDDGMEAIASLDEGSLPALERLYLGSNRISGNGCELLATAIRKGVMPRLQHVDLSGNPASTKAKQAVISALPALASDTAPRSSPSATASSAWLATIDTESNVQDLAAWGGLGLRGFGGLGRPGGAYRANTAKRFAYIPPASYQEEWAGRVAASR